MLNYIVLYRTKEIMDTLHDPFGFQCYAEDADHAEEQCENAYPDCDIVWVWHGVSGIGINSALNEYFFNQS